MVSSNALQHGLRATDRLFVEDFDRDERKAFRALRTLLWDEWSPASPVEELLVEKIAVSQFRLYRMYGLERLVIENFVFKDCGGKSHVSEPSVQNLERLSRYEASIERTMKTALHELQRLQSIREMKPRTGTENLPA